MSEERMTPDEFARVLALPEDHPERRRAEGRRDFAAMKVMLAAFEAGEPADAATSESVRAELARRILPRVAGGEATSPAGASAPSPPAHARPPEGGTRGPFAALLAALARPAARWSVTFAGLALVAGLGWWSTARRAPEDVIRGERPAGAFDVRATLHGGSLDLTWTAVPEADGYRAILLGGDLTELARVDLGDTTAKTVGGPDVPFGLASGAATSVEVEALKAGAVIATTPARAIRLP